MTQGNTALTNNSKDPFVDVQHALKNKPSGPVETGGTGIGFVLFMVVLTAVFAALGFWQLARLDQKETLIAKVEARANSAPIGFPDVAEWSGFDADLWDFKPVELTGTFHNDDTVLVFTSLEDPRGELSGPGYWVVTPFELTGGGTVFVNRGYVPEKLKKVFVDGGNRPEGVLTITGMARISEAPNSFTPGADRAARIEYVRNIERMQTFVDPAQAPFAPVYVDQDAGEPGALPQGGETKISFPNRHMEYALTWFSLAILVPIMLLVWFRRNRKPAK